MINAGTRAYETFLKAHRKVEFVPAARAMLATKRHRGRKLEDVVRELASAAWKKISYHEKQLLIAAEGKQRNAVKVGWKWIVQESPVKNEDVQPPPLEPAQRHGGQSAGTPLKRKDYEEIGRSIYFAVIGKQICF